MNAFTAIKEWFSPVERVLSENDQISKGDKIRLTYGIRIPYFKETQLNVLCGVINQDPRFRVIGASVVGDRLIIDVEVLQSPLPLGVLVGVVTAGAAGILLILNFEKAEKLVEAATPVVGMIALAIGLIVLAPMFRRS